MPINHTTLPISSLSTSLSFYIETLKPLGYSVFKKFPGVVGFQGPNHAPDFWIASCPENEDSGGKMGRGLHVAFDVSSKSKVREFYDAALKAGATSNGPPGYRDNYTPGYYAAYILDPDGNNIEAVCYCPLWFVLFKNLPYLLVILAVGGAYWMGLRGSTLW